MSVFYVDLCLSIALCKCHAMYLHCYNYTSIISYSFAADEGTIACPVLVAPFNGAIDITVTTPAATVSYSCRSGYVLDGPMTRTCLANGTWSGSDPVCNRK